jgi:hypothetical protein
VQGDVLIAKGKQILGASTYSGLGNWDAVKVLLSVTEASYEFHDFTQVNIGNLNQGLTIRVTKIIETLPKLPDLLEALNTRLTLNRIRAIDQASPMEIQNASVNKSIPYDSLTSNQRAISRNECQTLSDELPSIFNKTQDSAELNPQLALISGLESNYGRISAKLTKQVFQTAGDSAQKLSEIVANKILLFEEKSMKWRALVLWIIFATISLTIFFSMRYL